MDPSLSEEGFKQANSLNKISSKWHIEHILVSPLQRSYQTADCIFNNQNITCSISPRIRELYLHEIENRIHSIETIKSQFSKLSLYNQLQLSSLEALENTDNPEINTYFNISKENNKELPCSHHNSNSHDDYMSGLLPIEGVLDYLYSLPYNNIAVVTHWGFLNGALKIPVIHNCDVYEVLLQPINPPPSSLSTSSSSFGATTTTATTGTATLPFRAGTTTLVSPLLPLSPTTNSTSISDTDISVVVNDDDMSRAEPGRLLIPVKVIRKRLIERVTHNI